MEAYDLDADPRETHDISEGGDARIMAAHGALERYAAAAASKEGPAAPPEAFDADTLEKLRALGYVR